MHASQHAFSQLRRAFREPTKPQPRAILASHTPTLVIATAWPDVLHRQQDPGTLGHWLATASLGSSLVRLRLEALSEVELLPLVLGVAPRTDRRTAYLLASRADGNPFVLELLLTTPQARRSYATGAIELSDSEIDGLPNDLVGLLTQKWRELPDEVKALLVAAAMQGEVFLMSLVEDALRPLSPEAASSSSLRRAQAEWWIRPRRVELFEFLERVFYEIAHERSERFFRVQETQDLKRRTLVAVRRELTGTYDEDARLVLQAIHLRLAEEGIETDVQEAARTAESLATSASDDQAREQAVALLTQAAAWWDQYDPLSPDAIRCTCRAARLLRIEGEMRRSAVVAEACVEQAVERLGEQHPLSIRARRDLAMTLRRLDPPDLARAVDLANECRTSLGDRNDDRRLALELDELQVLLHRDHGDVPGSLDLAVRAVAEAEATFGPLDPLTQDLLQLAGFRQSELDPAAALPLRERYLSREMQRRGGTQRHRAVSGPLADLASNLSSVGRHVEALRMIAQAVELRRIYFGDDNSQTLRVRDLEVRIQMGYGDDCQRAGETREAEEWHERAYAGATSVVAASASVDGERSPRHLLFLSRLARTALVTGRFDEASRVARRVVSQRLRNGVPADDPRIQRLLLVDLRGASALGRIGEAEAFAKGVAHTGTEPSSKSTGGT